MTTKQHLRVTRVLGHVRPSRTAEKFEQQSAMKKFDSPTPTDWGEAEGYPATPSDYVNKQGSKMDERRAYRVDNYSGGFEKIFPHRVIRSGDLVSPMSAPSGHFCAEVAVALKFLLKSEATCRKRFRGGR